MGSKPSTIDANLISRGREIRRQRSACSLHELRHLPWTSDEDAMALGALIEHEYRQAITTDRMAEWWAHDHFKRETADERLKSSLCCGDEPWANGMCPCTRGRCPRLVLHRFVFDWCNRFDESLN